MSDRSRTSGTRAARRAGRSLYQVVLDVVLTGIVVILPLVVTLYVLSAAFDLIAGALGPVIQVLQWAGLIEGLKRNGVLQFLFDVGIYTDVADVLTELLALLILLTVVVVVGAVARFQYGERVIDLFDYLVMSIPGVGAVYKSFRRMGDAMLESDVENFRAVRLVEFPYDDVYVIGFETNTAPGPVQTAAGRDGMVTLFLPLAPNPVMGGFLAHIPEERVSDVDMSVEDAVRTIITSGIATEEENDQFRPLLPEERRRLQFLGFGDDADD